MQNEHTPDPGVSQPETPLTDTDTPSVETASPLRFLQTGVAVLDEQLRAHRVPWGGLVHLDFEAAGDSHKDTRPLSLLLGLCKAALKRQKRVVCLYVPLAWSEDPKRRADLCAGRALAPEFESGLEEFALSPFINLQNPSDPAAALRYLVASTPDEFEQRLSDLLEGEAPTPSPDIVVVCNMEQLFADIAFYPVSLASGEDELHHVLEANARLRGWLERYQYRCLQTGTALYLSRSAHSYLDCDSALFSYGLRSLLHRHCPTTLFAELAPLQNHRRHDMPALQDVANEPDERRSDLRGHCWVPLSLYEHETLRTRVFAPMQEGSKGNAGAVTGFGPFLEEDTEEMTALWIYTD